MLCACAVGFSFSVYLRDFVRLFGIHKMHSKLHILCSIDVDVEQHRCAGTNEQRARASTQTAEHCKEYQKKIIYFFVVRRLPSERACEGSLLLLLLSFKNKSLHFLRTVEHNLFALSICQQPERQQKMRNGTRQRERVSKKCSCVWREGERERG